MHAIVCISLAISIVYRGVAVGDGWGWGVSSTGEVPVVWGTHVITILVCAYEGKEWGGVCAWMFGVWVGVQLDSFGWAATFRSLNAETFLVYTTGHQSYLPLSRKAKHLTQDFYKFVFVKMRSQRRKTTLDVHRWPRRGSELRFMESACRYSPAFGFHWGHIGKIIYNSFKTIVCTRANQKVS